jgi:hypothetical protein
MWVSVSFGVCFFSTHQPLRDLDDVVQEIRGLEDETEGLLEQILDFGKGVPA